MFVKLNGVTHDGADSRRGNDVRVEAVLVHGLFLFQCSPVSHIHRFPYRPFDIVVVGRQVEEILVEQLYVRLGLHGEVGFQPCTLGKKRNVSVKYINLLPFLIDQRNAAPDRKGTDDGAASDYRKYRHHGQSGFLCKGFNKHIVKRFEVI
jgi:hypothetical protein